MQFRLLVPITLSLCSSPVFAQTPGSYVPFGKSCGSGATPPLLSAPKLPVIGREFAITVTNVQPNNVGFLVFGASNTRWNNINLPAPLAGLGAPGCNLYVSIDGHLLLNTGSGTAYLQVVIPKAIPLVGATFFNQFISPDPRANTAGLAFSNGAKATVGSCLCLPAENVTEDFMSDAMLDKDQSGGAWFGGKAFSAQVGGTGRHGKFDHTLGKKVDAVYEWNTDNMTIPATHTESGRAEVVRNGVFEFSSMNVPDKVIVRFTGSNAAQIKVRGIAQIDGTIQVNGTDAGFFGAVPTPGAPVATGQAGSLGGPGGGRGGKGGDSCPNTGANTRYDGQAGADVRLKAGHAYATQSRGTAGKGSPHWPRNGRNTVFCALTGVFAAGIAAGGGGGGFVTKGKDGVATKNACNQNGQSGSAPNSAGIAFPIGLLAPRTTGPNRSLDHYGVGGSGGGGGGSHPFLSRRFPFDKWVPGSGGTGGGGILAIRVGRHLGMGLIGRLESRGGTGYVIDSVRRTGEPNDNLFNVPSPGGAGSGGTVLLQVGITTKLSGLLDCSGGQGGVLDNSPANQAGLLGKAAGGDGAPGYLRLETPVAPPPSQLGQTSPKADVNNVGRLVDYDVRVTSQSKVYNSGLSFSPHFLRYEIEADVGGRKVLYSDDPTLTHPNFVGPASAGQPVQFRIQGSKLDQKTNKVTWQGPWRDNVRTGMRDSLGSDDANSWRFQLTYDRTTVASIVVTKVTVWYQR